MAMEFEDLEREDAYTDVKGLANDLYILITCGDSSILTMLLKYMMKYY